MKCISSTRFTIVAFFWCFTSLQAFSQTNSFDGNKIVGPTPTAASLGNFGNNSKGTYNGVPEITIPVLHVDAAAQNIDIVLRYDASGVKPAQDASWVGLGWSLSFGGGVITRTVRGLDDLYSGGYHFTGTFPETKYSGLYAAQILYSNDYFSHPEDYLYFQALRNGLYDCEPDIFTFSFGNYNGRFVFDKVVNGSGVYELDNTNLKITYVQPGWKIEDGDGNSYYFNAQETFVDYSLTRDYELDFDADYFDLVDENLNRHETITAWYLDSIVTSSSQKIIFTYSSEQSQSLLNKSETRYNMLQMNGSCTNSCFTTTGALPVEQNIYVASRQLQYTKLPKTIEFDNGTIEFVTSTRDDIKIPEGSSPVHRLSDIILKNKLGETVKRYTLSHSYFNATTLGDKRLKLDALTEYSSINEAKPPFTFSYFNPDQLPPKYTKAVDHWGYFNNSLTNTTLLPAKLVQDPWYRNFPGADRLPTTFLDAVQNGVLSSIRYPTGGQAVFEYELNEYTNLYGDDQYEPTDKTLSLGETFNGEPDKEVSFELFEPREVKFTFNYSYRSDPNYRNEFIPDYAFLEMDGNPYITFHNAQPYPNPEITSQTILLGPGNYKMKLSNVTDYNTGIYANWIDRKLISKRKGGGLRIKKITNLDGFGSKTVKAYRYEDNGISTGLLLNPISYDYNVVLGQLGNFLGESCVATCTFYGNYLFRSSNAMNSDGFSRGGIIGYSKVIEILGENGGNGKIEYTFNNIANPYLSFPALPIPNNPLNGKLKCTNIFDENNALIKKIENEYAVNGTSSLYGVKLINIPFSTDNFLIQYYNNASSWIWKSKQIETSYFGTNSIVSTTNYFYDNFAHKQLTRSESTLSNGDLVKKVYKYSTDFQSTSQPNEYNSMVERHMLNPVVEQIKSKNGVDELQRVKTNYSFFNGQTIIKPSKTESSILNSALEGETIIDKYDSKGNILQFTGKDGVVTSYFWGYNGANPVAKVVGVSYDVVKGLIDQGILDNANGTYTDQQIRAELDKLRTGLVNLKALVYSFTYIPLVGMTSETDPNGRTTYYEYDGFNRLKLVKDKDGNIIKTFQYKYAEQ